MPYTRCLLAFTLGILGCSSTSNHNGEPPPDAAPPDAPEVPIDAAPTGPAQQLTTGGLLEAVSPDQSELAYIPSPASIAGVLAGTLVVSPLSTSDASTSVGNAAWSAVFAGNNNVLVYLTGPTASIDAGPAAVYGAANLWQPGMTAGIKLSNGFAPRRVTALDNSWTMFWDTPAASLQGTGDVVLVRAADCTASACAPLQLATGVNVVSTVLSPDGLYAAYAVRNAPGSFGIYLVTIATGVVSTITSSGSSGSIGFSPDGTLLASVGPQFALQVTTTATLAPTSWGKLPIGTQSSTVGFADPATLLVRGQATAGGDVTIYETTATTSSPVASGPSTLAMFIIRNTSATTGTARYLFTSTAPSSGIGDLEAYDLTATSPSAIPVATAAALNSIAVSFDQTYVRVLENFDPSAQTGTLTLATLPDGSISAFPAGVALGASSFTHAHTLLYIDPDNSNALTEWTDGSSATLSTAVTAFRLRSGNAYFSLDATDSLYGYAAGVYTTTLP